MSEISRIAYIHPDLLFDIELFDLHATYVQAKIQLKHMATLNVFMLHKTNMQYKITILKFSGK